MDAIHARAIWQQFDSALQKAPDSETEALVIAVKAHAEILNSRLAGIEQSLVHLIQIAQSTLDNRK